MRTILFAALLWAASAQALDSKDLLPADAPIAQAAKKANPAEDEEEDPTPGAKTTPPPNAPKVEEKKEAPAMGAVSTTPPVGNANQQKLVSGAPLYNPNVAVHIIEQKAYSDVLKSEVILFPAQVQINGKFTQHFGVGLAYVFHLQENFGFQLTGFYNYVSTESGFNTELADKLNVEAQAATSLLNTWGALGGVEVTPFYGKFAFYENNLAHFSIVLNGGVGVGGTRHQLKPANGAGPATFGDTGLRFLGGLGGGLRLQIGKRWAFRMEVRDVVYTARVDAVNGCNRDDLAAMNTANSLGRKPSSAATTPGCNVSSFEGTDPDSGQKRNDGLPLAFGLVCPKIPGSTQCAPSSDVLNNLGLYIGAAFLF